MTSRQTEQLHTDARGLDLRPGEEVLQLLAAGQSAAAEAVQSAIPDIARGAKAAAQTIRDGGRLIYAAAGSSGLMALADALELPGTYGIDRQQVVVLLAGGMDALQDIRGGPEDDADAAIAAVTTIQPSSKDCLISLTASGHTPYPIAAAQTARSAGARTVGLANNAGAALFDHVDVSICLPTPPEVIAGSTRMGAGTAQKIALNMLSTLMAMELGHVHDGMMVNVIADNEKLRGRARGIVMAAAGVDETRAIQALEASHGAVKPAILIAAGASPQQAETLLTTHNGMLRPALAELG
ncbi:N-acetylmuramic acid 6-phosphate etherase [Devosia aurantiaca]|uniref:N-acetylmuramic acid 6-phosphate etherase n=1 Tax=Devosia aurantiaca TaxID=2714858 RepID=A0A6M1SXL6_9HYPH|nr:N-acetylmuramic acid 6-phosphate etherase [Devosia aurantiaca]NGP19023.1 N-acetylmuramic acid 6-phosphate etherase [Devosia aurantiaca]